MAHAAGFASGFKDMNEINTIRFFGRWQVIAAQAIPAERCRALEKTQNE